MPARVANARYTSREMPCSVKCTGPSAKAEFHPPGWALRKEWVLGHRLGSSQVNGVIVNECFDTGPSAGKILLQNEGNEIYYRRPELHPLKK